MNRLKDPKLLIIATLSLLLLIIPMTIPMNSDIVTNFVAPIITPILGPLIGQEETTAPTDSAEPPAAPTVPSFALTPALRAEKLVGICLPDKNIWELAGSRLQAELVTLGYQVKLVYGDGTAQKQNTQMLELLAENAGCLIVAPVDSVLLTEATAAAIEKNVPILSFGSLLMDTEATTGYVCYDYQAMGKQVAEYVAEQLSLDTAKAENRVHTVELFMGSPEDYNAVLFYNGVISALEPYRTSGVLNIKSLRTTFESCCIWDWDAELAQKKCAERLEQYYQASAPDACICASDNIAAGVIAALDAKGQTSLVTGNGNTSAGRNNMTAGKQALTISTTVEEPAIACGTMVDWLIFGAVPDITLGEVSNNAVTIPTALCGFTLIKK